VDPKPRPAFLDVWEEAHGLPPEPWERLVA
jgi:hypothetical protein